MFSKGHICSITVLAWEWHCVGRGWVVSGAYRGVMTLKFPLNLKFS